MKNNLIAASLCLSLALPTTVFADVSVSSSLAFNFSGFTAAPRPSMYLSSDKYYGSVSYSDGPTISYPWAPNGNLYLDPSYQDSQGGAWGNVTASWSATTGNGSLNLHAIDNNPDTKQTWISLSGMGGYFQFLGPYSTLPDFSYTFTTSGSKDSASEQIGAGVGFTVGYSYYDDTASRWIHTNLAYDNWSLLSLVGNELLNFDDSHANAFSGLTVPNPIQGETYYWFIDYGFTAVGMADNGVQENAAPEPATLLLMGAGLLGLGALRQRSAILPTFG
ncbi:MAG: hypothetical protein CVU33_16645 [Betaproteobacteria bacterium HGW-Betaproteobacteria-6]|jgi:hypothetical protein|nr:MAG: hypothetical protein CVU33_16645 [Betaproteobacteria bacterium HGW-Betaproteobacteria-6]